MMRNPLLAGVAASAGTFLAMGAATALISGVALSVSKRVVRHRKLQAATTCTTCQGSGYMSCDICRGKAIIRCRAPTSLRSLRRKQPAADAAASPGTAFAVCPGCGTTMQQRCLNCLGEGRACLPA